MSPGNKVIGLKGYNLLHAAEPSKTKFDLTMLICTDGDRRSKFLRRVGDA